MKAVVGACTRAAGAGNTALTLGERCFATLPRAMTPNFILTKPAIPAVFSTFVITVASVALSAKINTKSFSGKMDRRRRARRADAAEPIEQRIDLIVVLYLPEPTICEPLERRDGHIRDQELMLRDRQIVRPRRERDSPSTTRGQLEILLVLHLDRLRRIRGQQKEEQVGQDVHQRSEVERNVRRAFV